MPPWAIGIEPRLPLYAMSQPVLDRRGFFNPRGPFSWGTVGDSWASGVAYSSDTTYDNNAGGCMRLITAYKSLMQQYASAWSMQMYRRLP